MSLDNFCGAFWDLDNTHMEIMGAGLADVSESDIFDAWAMILGYPL